MPKKLFRCIEETLTKRSIFIQKEDATEKSGITQRMQIVRAFRIMDYGMYFG